MIIVAVLMLKLKDFRFKDNGERVYDTDSSDDDSSYN
jgi:hypothetical protein